jgi:hypothetical protein
MKETDIILTKTEHAKMNVSAKGIVFLLKTKALTDSVVKHAALSSMNGNVP